MSIKIVTPTEADHMKQLATKYNECFEEVRGKANSDYLCDNTGVSIPKDSDCAVVMILPNQKHFNYEHQKRMLGNYVH